MTGYISANLSLRQVATEGNIRVKQQKEIDQIKLRAFFGHRVQTAAAAADSSVLGTENTSQHSTLALPRQVRHVPERWDGHVTSLKCQHDLRT